MIWTILIGSFSFLLTWQFFRPYPPPIAGVYRQPGPWYLLKKVIFKLIFKIRQYRHRKATRRGTNRNHNRLDRNRGYGSGTSNGAQLDEICPIDPDPNGIDAVYFGSFNKDGVRCVIRFARRHGRCAEIWLFLEIPGIGCLQHPLHPDTHLTNVTGRDYSGGGLRIEMVEPMRIWKLSFSGILRHGLCNDVKLKPENYLHTTFSFLWTCTSDPFNFDTDIDASAIADAVARETWNDAFWKRLRSKHQTHYEQWGVMRGRIKVEGYDEIQLSLKTLRDHSYGVRDWRTLYRYAIHFITLESGIMIQTGVVCQPETLSCLQVGWLNYPCGEIHAVSKCDLKLWEVTETEEPKNQYSFTFVAGGDEFHVEVTGETTPIWYHHEDRGSKVFEKFCKYKVNGKPGYGLVEFHYRNTEGKPLIVQESVPLVQEPSIQELKNHIEALALTFDEVACCSSRLVGGKGAQLGQLVSIQQKLNAVVPRGFCLTFASFVKQVESNHDLLLLVDGILSALREEGNAQLKTACADTVEGFATTTLVQEVEATICNKMKYYLGDDLGNKLFAVRSSASGEDGTEASSAGLMETYLGVKGQAGVLEAVRKCWASAFTYQAVQYRRQNGQPIKIAVGVVIQEMVQSQVSGVIFTNDPVTGSPNHMTLDASYGLGEAVVSGKTTPDTIIIYRHWNDMLSIKKKCLGNKKFKITIKDDGGTEEVESGDSSEECCLSDKLILQLADMGVQVERYFGSPRDIEWAVMSDQIYLLQARPITTLDMDTEEDLLHEFDGGLVTDREWLTTANIGEIMPGAITPLSLSVFIRAIAFGSDRFASAACGSPEVKYHSKSLFVCMNRAFISMNSVGMISLYNIIGVKEGGELAVLGETLPQLTEEDIKEYTGKRRTRWDRIRNIFNSLMVSHRRIKYFRTWNDRVDHYFIGEQADNTFTLYRDITENLPDYFRAWEGSIFQSSFSGVWSNVVMGILTKGEPVWTQQHCADLALLLSKCEGVYSAEVPTAIQRIAREVVNAGIKEDFLSAADKKCVELMKADEYPDLQKTFQSFMLRHGHRYIREAELIERSWRAEPEKLARVVKTILRTNSYEQKEREVLSISDAISQIKSPVSWIGRQILKLVVHKARKAVGEREHGKSLSVKICDVFKEAYWRLADMMVDEGRLPEKELLFFLTHVEIGKLIRTRSPKLINKAIRRKKILPKQMEMYFPKLQCGMPKPVQLEDFKSQRKTSFKLQGMPVFIGVAVSTARVVKSLEEADSIQRGEILIVPYTDVGWTPYFPLVSGLVTELGGLVSHGAVVAREYGLPCLVNVDNATQLFRSGDLVRLDSAAGTIEKLEKEEQR